MIFFSSLSTKNGVCLRENYFNFFKDITLFCRVSLKELHAELCDIRVDEFQFEAINIAPWFIVIVGVQPLQPALSHAVTSMYGYVYYAGVRTR